MILVVQHVAVDDEFSGVVGEVTGKENFFVGVDEERLLQAVFLGRRRLAVALEQVPVGVVQVHHVGDVGLVDDLPGLGRVQLRERLEWAGLKVRPLIRQVVLKKPPIVISQRLSGRRLALRVQAGSGRR